MHTIIDRLNLHCLNPEPSFINAQTTQTKKKQRKKALNPYKKIKEKTSIHHHTNRNESKHKRKNLFRAIDRPLDLERSKDFSTKQPLDPNSGRVEDHFWRFYKIFEKTLSPLK